MSDAGDPGEPRDPGDWQAGEIVSEDGFGRLSSFGQPRRSDHAQADTVARPVTREAEPVARAPDIESGALDVLPPERAPDGDAQILTADLIGPQTVEPDPRDAAGPRARDYARVAQMLAPEAGRAQRAHEIGVAQFRRPLWHAPTCLVFMRRQERWIFGARPHRRGDFGAAAARRRVEDRCGRAVAQQQTARGRLGRALGCRRRGTNDLTVRLIAQVEVVGAMASAVREREGANRNRERFERRRLTVA